MDMKVSVLLLLLLAATWTGSQGVSFRYRSLCCSKEMFRFQRIPEKKIQGYQETNPECDFKAVLVKMSENKMVCVDPEEKWFKKYQRKQKKPNSTST